MDLRYPLKNLIYERLKQQKNIMDVDLLNELKKEEPDITMKDVNKALLSLEIMGLVSVRWVRKDARRIEIIEKAS
jgi:Fe2+ or Zn2+ uptake regulation protein